jgi:hypothetical protein
MTMRHMWKRWRMKSGQPMATVTRLALCQPRQARRILSPPCEGGVRGGESSPMTALNVLAISVAEHSAPSPRPSPRKGRGRRVIFAAKLSGSAALFPPCPDGERAPAGRVREFLQVAEEPHRGVCATEPEATPHFNIREVRGARPRIPKRTAYSGSFATCLARTSGARPSGKPTRDVRGGRSHPPYPPFTRGGKERAAGTGRAEAKRRAGGKGRAAGTGRAGEKGRAGPPFFGAILSTETPCQNNSQRSLP